MTINIEIAEEIVNLFSSKKNAGIQKKLLNQIIDQVQEKRRQIYEFQLTVDIISRQYHNKKQSLEHLINQLDSRGKSLDQGLVKIESQQKELEKKQLDIEQELSIMRITAEKYREKKTRCEQQYSSVISVPILSAQSKKKYIKARDRYAEAEQQVSELRQAFDKCREHLKLISKTVSAQYSEQDQLCNQRRGSVDTIMSSTQQLDYLIQGREFWFGFDTYQAKVILESAIYLSEMEPSTNNKKKANQILDMEQVWQKTFKLACFEYGDREIYGDTRWNTDCLEVSFDCEMCQTSQTGWPKVIRGCELACELCHSTIPEATAPIQQINSITIIDPTIGKLDLNSSPHLNSSKMKKVLSTLFHYHPRVGPL